VSVRREEALPGAPAPSPPAPGATFDMQPVRVRPLPGSWLPGWAFPSTVQLGRARGARDGERVAFLVHGFAMNEDYFALLAPELCARGYDVWALRLPGYLPSGERAAWLWPVHVGMSIAFYAWVTASAIAHIAHALAPRHLLAWGHSFGGAVLHAAMAAWSGREWPAPERLVLEAPAYREAIGFSTAMVTALSALPEGTLNALARSLLIDDIRANETARQQGLAFIPGRASRLVLTMNALALANPLSRTVPLPPEALARCRFVVAEFDRLVDHDRLVALLDGWRVRAERRLVLPRNHLLSLTSAAQVVAWLEDG
jgi:pimeloyl-ACP methyl ester carboxylesterase